MKILVVTGSSGGHVFPAISFLQSLKESFPDSEAVLVLPKAKFNKSLDFSGYNTKYISISNISFKNLGKLFKGFFESLGLLSKYRPDVVVGFGSLTCVPMLCLASLFGIKSILHEQNVIPGRANRFLSVFVTKIAISFGQTKEYFKNHAKKIVLTGNPLRRELKIINKEEAKSFFGLSPDKFTVLVMGGSQGSSRINNEFLRVISDMPERNNLQLIHLSGDNDYEFLCRRYSELGSRAKVYRFFDSMEYAYSAADLVLARAGATTISELIFFKLPAVLIPYPFAYQHQLANARVLDDAGCAVIVEDKELGGNKLKSVLQEVIGQADKLKTIREGYNELNSPDAGKLLVKMAVSLKQP